MRITINSAKLVPPFAIGSIDGVYYAFTSSGKHPVNVSRDGDELTIGETF